MNGKKYGMTEAFEWAKKKLMGVDINNHSQIKSLLAAEGWNDSMIEKFKKWGMPVLSGAKMAKKVGFDPLKKMGIDIDKIDPNEIEKTVKNITNPQQSSPFAPTKLPYPQYPAYDRRNSPTFSSAYESRASKLPK